MLLFLFFYLFLNGMFLIEKLVPTLFLKIFFPDKYLAFDKGSQMHSQINALKSRQWNHFFQI